MWNCGDGIFDFYDVFGVANIRFGGLRKKKMEVLITWISYLLLLKDKKKTLKIIFKVLRFIFCHFFIASTLLKISNFYQVLYFWKVRGRKLMMIVFDVLKLIL